MAALGEKELELLKEIKKIFEARDDFKVDYNNPGPLENEYVSSFTVSPIIPIIIGWDDLPSLENRDCVKVKLNYIEYELVIHRDCLNDIYVQLYREDVDGHCINLLSDFFRDNIAFNNLQLELIPEEDS